MLFKIKNRIIAIFLLINICSFHLPAAENALLQKDNATVSGPVYVVDAAGIEDKNEIFLLTSLQGIVNRERPRMFVKAYFHKYGPEEEIFMDYLSKEKGYRFKWVTLAEAIEVFSREGLIKGMVHYDGNNYEQGCVAATMAGLKDYIPVCDQTLKQEGTIMSGKDRVVQDSFSRIWISRYATVDYLNGGKGVRLTATKGFTNPINAPRAGLQTWISIDTAATPYLEINVAEATGKWSLILDQGAVHNGFDSWVWVERDTERKGVIRYDLGARKDLVPGLRRTLVRIIVPNPDSALTLTSFRLLDADGNVPKINQEKREPFAGLKVEMELSGKFSDSDKLWDWAEKELLPQCSKTYAFAAQPGWFNTRGIDLAVAKKAFIFQKMDTNNKAHDDSYTYPLLESVLRHLNRPGIMLGWIGVEWTACTILTAYGHSMLHSGAANLSFWARVPTAGAVKLPRGEVVQGGLKNKFYVTSSINPGDCPNGFMSMYWNSGNWCDKARGTVPMTWLMNPVMNEVAPAVLEYFANTSTRLDSFMISPTGAGYTYPSVIEGPEQDVLYPFIDESRRLAQLLGLDAMVSWDPGRHRPFPRWLEPGPYPPFKLYVKSVGFRGASGNYFLPDGTPLLSPGLKPEYGSILQPGFVRTEGYTNMERISESVPRHLEYIRNVAKEKRPPYFIFMENQQLPPTYMKMVAEQLGPEFEVIGAGDLVRLARESAQFNVVKESDGIGRGGSMQVRIELYNPDGIQGDAGVITWKLPEGFSCPESQWQHGNVPKGGRLIHTIRVQAPKQFRQANELFEFFDSRIQNWNRSFQLNCYSGESFVIEDSQHQADWNISGKGEILRHDGLVEFHPVEPRNLHTYCRLIVKKEKFQDPYMETGVKIDFDRGPLLELNMEDAYGKFSLSLAQKGEKAVSLYGNSNAVGISTADLAKETGWTGEKTVTLRLQPRVNHGGGTGSAYVRSIIIHYQK